MTHKYSQCDRDGHAWLECLITKDHQVTTWVSDCVFSAAAYSPVGEEAADHRGSPPFCPTGSVPFLFQAVRHTGASAESNQQSPGDRGQEQSQCPQSAEEGGEFQACTSSSSLHQVSFTQSSSQT